MENKKNTKIVIVENEAIIALELEEILKDLGYNVIANCLSGEEFLSMIDNKLSPDLVFMEIKLGGKLDGIETVKELKKKIDIPVIYLTHNSNTTIIERAKETKPAAFLLKPFDESQVYSAVEISVHSYIRNKEVLVEHQKKLDLNQMQISELVETQNHLITATWRERDLKQELIKTKSIIAEKHKEITDSINYAERIQHSLLPNKSFLDDNLNEYFVFYRPKHVVSGDFFWATKLNNGNFALVTADSTGHGVPGAIMSILNISCLKESVKEGLVNPAEILNRTRTFIIDILSNDGSAEGGKDGMDASLLCFDFFNSKLIYAAANNPIWVVRDKSMIVLAPDKIPIGKHDRDQTSFNQHEFQLLKGDIIYTLTDGMADQFGGPKGKKFMYKPLKEMLIHNSSDTMEVQKQKLAETFDTWKGNLEQVDDVCIIGVKI